MIDIVILYPHQSYNDLAVFLKQENLNPIVLSVNPVLGYNNFLFIPSSIPYIDDQYIQFSSLLNQTDGDEFRIIDWESIFYSGSSIEVESQKLTELNSGAQICQEDIRAQDYRVPPYMENLIKISQEIFNGNNYLFDENPKIFTPKLIIGSKENLLKTFLFLIEKREQITNNGFTGSLIILNTFFKKNDSR